MTFLNNNLICLGYSPTDYVLYSLKSGTISEVLTPVQAATSSTSLGGMGMGALSGLGGYIGLGAKAKPSALSISDKECFIARESGCVILCQIRCLMALELDTGIVVGEDGKPARASAIEWPAPPEDIGEVFSNQTLASLTLQSFYPTLHFHCIPSGHCTYLSNRWKPDVFRGRKLRCFFSNRDTVIHFIATIPDTSTTVRVVRLHYCCQSSVSTDRPITYIVSVV